MHQATDLYAVCIVNVLVCAALAHSPQVLSIAPRYVSAAGGTTLTIIGSWLNSTQLVAIHFGDSNSWTPNPNSTQLLRLPSKF